MKLSDVRQCDGCHGPLAERGLFYVLRMSLAFISPRALQQTMGLTQILGGALGLAEVLSPDPDVIKVAMDEDRQTMIELVLCQNCYMGQVCLAEASETRSRAIERANEESRDV